MGNESHHSRATDYQPTTTAELQEQPLGIVWRKTPAASSRATRVVYALVEVIMPHTLRSLLQGVANAGQRGNWTLPPKPNLHSLKVRGKPGTQPSQAKTPAAAKTHFHSTTSARKTRPCTDG